MITNQVIEEKFKEIKESLERIENQTTKTNGTVASLVEWKNFSKGAITTISCFVVPIMLYLLYIHIAK